MDLDKLLQQEAGVGRLDSSGQFSVDLQKMRVKLSQYQLAEPGFYVLKLIQAAVASGSARVDVALKSGRVEVAFDQAPPLTAVLEALALRGASRAARHLAVGLNAAMNVADRVAWTAGERMLILTKNDTEVAAATGPPGVVIKKTKRMLALPASTRSERDAVYSRCSWAPVDVVLDGQTLGGPFPAPGQADWHLRLSQPFYLMRHYDLGRGLRLPGPQLGAEARREGGAWVSAPPARSWLTEFSAFRPVDEELLNCRAVFGLPLALQGPSAVVFLLDGVALDPEIVPGGPPGALALVAADELAVDLSQFKAVQDHAYLKRVDAVWDRWNTMAARIESSLAELHGRRDPTFWATVGSEGSLGKIAGTMIDTFVTAGHDRRLRQEVALRLKERT